MLSKFYREQKLARPPARVKAEVEEAMLSFDEDRNGTLEAKPSQTLPSTMLLSTHAVPTC